jgi:hypothetical protein
MSNEEFQGFRSRGFFTLGTSSQASFKRGQELLLSKPAIKQLVGALDHALKNVPSATFHLKFGYLSWSNKPYYREHE